MVRSDIQVFPYSSLAQTWSNGGSNHVIETPSGVLYHMMSDLSHDYHFVKSVDRGRTWTTLFSFPGNTALTVATWYDRWSGLTTDRIHVAYSEQLSPFGVYYFTVDVANGDVKSATVLVHSGNTSGTGGGLSLTRAMNGDMYLWVYRGGFVGTDGGFYQLPNASVPEGAWDPHTIPEAFGTQDQLFLFPGTSALPSEDVIAFFYDASSTQISRYIYDASLNTWTETIIGTFVLNTSTNNFPHFSIALDLTNNRFFMAAHSRWDFPTANLQCWEITPTTITQLGNIVSNSGGNQGLALLTLMPNGNLWAFYGGKSDGSEVFGTVGEGPNLCHVYGRLSTDLGLTWGPELRMTQSPKSVRGLLGMPVSLFTTNPVSQDPPVFYFGVYAGLEAGREQHNSFNFNVTAALMGASPPGVPLLHVRKGVQVEVF